MSTINKSCADNLRGRGVPKAVEEIRRSIVPLIGPDAMKVLTAIAADVAAGIEMRNPREDVARARKALTDALVALEAVDGNLDG